MHESVGVCQCVCMCKSVCMHECVRVLVCACMSVFASAYGGSRETPKTHGTVLYLEEFHRFGRHE